MLYFPGRLLSESRRVTRWEETSWRVYGAPMHDIGLQAVAGIAATAVFVGSTLPMLLKAGRTKDLRSYSLANIALANLGNLLQWVYISSLPLGPIWLLHGFNSGSTALMLVWYLRYAARCVSLPCLVSTAWARFLQFSETQRWRERLRGGLTLALRGGKSLTARGIVREVALGACC